VPRLGVLAVFTFAVPASDGRAGVLAVGSLPRALSVLRRPSRRTWVVRSPVVGLRVVAGSIGSVPLGDGRSRGGVYPGRRRRPSAAISTAPSSAIAIALAIALAIATSVAVPIPWLGEVALAVVRVPDRRRVDRVGLASGGRNALSDVGRWRSRNLNSECFGLLASDRHGVGAAVGYGDGAGLASVLSLLKLSRSCLVLGDNVTRLVEEGEGISAGGQSPGDKSCAHG